jgi:hypothetical protein
LYSPVASSVPAAGLSSNWVHSIGEWIRRTPQCCPNWDRLCSPRPRAAVSRAQTPSVTATRRRQDRLDGQRRGGPIRQAEDFEEDTMNLHARMNERSAAAVAGFSGGGAFCQDVSGLYIAALYDRGCRTLLPHFMPARLRLCACRRLRRRRCVETESGNCACAAKTVCYRRIE